MRIIKIRPGHNPRGEWSVTRSESGKVLVELTTEQFEALKALKEHQL